MRFSSMVILCLGASAMIVACGDETDASEGAAGARVAVCEGEPPPSCVDCFTSPVEGKQPECTDGVWHCPAGTSPHAECPANSCVWGATTDCCHSTGLRTPRVCDDSGMLVACPAGSIAVETGGVCAPEGVTVSDCKELDGLACASVELECHNLVQCSYFCRCEPGAGGSLQWWCDALAC